MPDLFSPDIPEDAPHVVIYTDGACIPNPGRGGWAALLTWTNGCDRTTEKMISGCQTQSTNNRMELKAVAEALRALTRPCQVTIVTDSNLIVKCARGEWRRKSNQDLWRAFDAAAAGHLITLKWVKGHNGHPQNERVDDEARRQARLITAN